MEKLEMKKILIIGATSRIARETAKLFASDGVSLYLLARDQKKLCVLSEDLKVRGAAQIFHRTFEATDFRQCEVILSDAIQSLGGLDAVLIAHGMLPDQKSCEGSYEETEKALRINFLSVVSFLTFLANFMDRQGHGCIAVISSVAGDRGRQSNYIYGAAKGALSIFLQGLRNRLAIKGVAVVTIKPGFVDTPMTSHLKQGFLYARAEHVAADIHNAMKRGKNVVYTPWYWRFIMAAILAIPECIFKKMHL